MHGSKGNFGNKTRGKKRRRGPRRLWRYECAEWRNSARNRQRHSASDAQLEQSLGSRPRTGIPAARSPRDFGPQSWPAASAGIWQRTGRARGRLKPIRFEVHPRRVGLQRLRGAGHAARPFTTDAARVVPRLKRDQISFCQLA
ncbi:hypothetical protein EVAR_92524_1 [Eumeta japonica]|uniref:Uncharacterized protein n=1 Tax=Eumeta variegata TaxID=151549 RepID=A0A4C1T792_EUMVA|nr:hypothetical protein EVAR_92524_1 [Eumeta japonica]